MVKTGRALISGMRCLVHTQMMTLTRPVYDKCCQIHRSYGSAYVRRDALPWRLNIVPVRIVAQNGTLCPLKAMRRAKDMGRRRIVYEI